MGLRNTDGVKTARLTAANSSATAFQTSATIAHWWSLLSQRGRRLREKWSWSLSLRLVFPVLHKPPGATITSRSAVRIRINFWRMVGLYISFGDWANALECWRSPSLRLVIPGIAVSPGVTHSDSRVVFVTGTVVKPQQPTNHQLLSQYLHPKFLAMPPLRRPAQRLSWGNKCNGTRIDAEPQCAAVRPERMISHPVRNYSGTAHESQHHALVDDPANVYIWEAMRFSVCCTAGNRTRKLWPSCGWAKIYTSTATEVSWLHAPIMEFSLPLWSFW